MSKRTHIINSFINHVSTTTGYVGFRGLRMLNEINTFPAFYAHPANESRQHIGNGSILAILALDVRGYGWGEGLNTIETLVRNLEYAVQQYAALHKQFVHEARVVSLRTDEGLMEPYCICDMSVEILYGTKND
jgi:hypothetical protein